MLIKTLPVGHLETNCYVVTDEDTLGCAVIDPGAEPNTILGYLEDNHLKCAAVMLTHAHFDHIGALDEVLAETRAPLYVNRRELGAATVPGFKPFNPPEATHYYSDGDTVRVGSLSFSVVETPGHTPGSVSLVCGDALFSGDTLFRLSCGRTDFPGGDMNAELRSLRKLAHLPGDYGVYPGHGPVSTPSRERRENPYLAHYHSPETAEDEQF